MEQDFPLEVLFNDGTTGRKPEDGKRVIAIKLDENSCIGLCDKGKENLDRCERKCDRDAQYNKDGIVYRPPTVQEAQKWISKKKEINATVDMLNEAGIAADRLSGDILTCSRKGFDNYKMNTVSGETSLLNSSSNMATFRPVVFIDKTPELPKAANYDWEFIKMRIESTRS